VGGHYIEKATTVAGHSVQIFELVNGPAARRFLLTNPEGYNSPFRAPVAQSHWLVHMTSECGAIATRLTQRSTAPVQPIDVHPYR
jgi:hypothetical protein